MTLGCYSIDFLKQSFKIKKLGGGTFGDVSLYETPEGKLAVKETKLTDKSLGYPPDLLAELDILIKLRSLVNVVKITGVTFDITDKKGYLLMEPCDMNLTKFSREYDFSARIKYLPKFLTEIGSVLSIMHRFNLIHNDIKTNNILVKNSSSGPIFKLADFGKSMLVHSAVIPYGGIKKYKPPIQLSIYFSEAWAFMVCAIEYILGGRMIRDARNSDLDEVRHFYRKYFIKDEFKLKKLLISRLGEQKTKQIPKLFWQLFYPITKIQDVTIYDCLKRAKIGLLTSDVERVSKNISKIKQNNYRLEPIIKEFKFKLQQLNRLHEYDRFKNLLNKFVENVSEELNDITLRYYAEVILIIIVKSRIKKYEYFKNQRQFLEFQKVLLLTIGYQIYI